VFEYVLRILNGIPGHPPDKQKEVDAVIKILTDGQGYLTKETPKQIRFFRDMK
jgi:hypothetical protein